jgi:hypothetical protein
MRVAVDHEPVHARAKGPIAQRLEVARVQAPALAVIGGERFGRHDAPAAGVRD